MRRSAKDEDFRHVRAIPWPSGLWHARRRIHTGHAGRLHGREHAWGLVQPRCRSGGGMGRGKGWRRRHRSGGGPLAWRNAHGRGRHPATQRTCARRAGRPTRLAGGRVGSTAARRGACNRTGRWRQQPPTRRGNRSRRAGTITRGASGRFDPRKSLRAVAARNSGRWGEAGGPAPSGLRDPCGRTVLLSHVTPFAFRVIATLPTSLRSVRTRMQTATSETESKSRDLSICVHHYTLRAPCPKGQGITFMFGKPNQTLTTLARTL